MTHNRYPGYDVLTKRDTPSWDAPTRAVIEARLRTQHAACWLGPSAWRALVALCNCVVPQGRQPDGVAETAASHAAPSPDDPVPAPAQDAEGACFVPVAALIDAKLYADSRDGYRDSRLPPLREAWSIGLAALDAESDARHRKPFAEVEPQQQRALVVEMQRGTLHNRAWCGMPSDLFFAKRALHDICAAFYSHPASWSALGFGGPANPRGYVRLKEGRRDPWEAAEARDDSDTAQAAAHEANVRIR